MYFYTIDFLIFFISLIVVWRFLPKNYRFIMFLGSLFFYGYWNWSYLILLVSSICVDFVVATYLQKSENPGRRKLLLFTSVFFNLSLLGVFKYWNFFVSGLNSLAERLEWSLTLPTHELALPFGISFFTFQTMSYTFDVYRKKFKHNGNFIEFANYVSFFPQLVAGPIIRFNDFEEQSKSESGWKLNFKTSYLMRFFMGWFKKVVIADALGQFADPIFKNGPANFLEAWSGALAYTGQIYLDFSAYSDMALALAAMMGFKFPENFNWPYAADSIRDFWRRWHISLSTWLRDYLYISLGGSRRGFTTVNLMITMLLGGLWHGAAWNYVIWGAYHGLLLTLCHLFPLKLPKRISQLLTFLLVVMGWVIFRCESLNVLENYLITMFTLDSQGILPDPHILAILGLLFFWHMVGQKYSWALFDNWPRLLGFVVLGVVIGLIIAMQPDKAAAPFIYFRF